MFLPWLQQIGETIINNRIGYNGTNNKDSSRTIILLNNHIKIGQIGSNKPNNSHRYHNNSRSRSNKMVAGKIGLNMLKLMDRRVAINQLP